MEFSTTSTSKGQSPGIELIVSQSSTQIPPRPAVVPQTTNLFVRSFSPFTRAYPPVLAELSDPISEDEFLHFVDGLNNAFVSNSISQLGWACSYIPLFVPLFIVKAIGVLIHVLFSTSTIVVTVIRTKMYMKKANKTLFTPRGLSCRIMTTKTMLKTIGATDPEDKKGKLKLPPFSEFDDPETYTGSQGFFAGVPEDPRLRRMRALQGHVSPLKFDFLRDPLPWRPHMKWANKRSVNGMIKKREKGLRELNKEAATLIEDLAALNREIEARAPDDAEQLERRNRIVEDIRQVGERKMKKADKKEERVANKVLWIVITREDSVVQRV